MKYLLILGLALVVFWLWQGRRRATLADKARSQGTRPTSARGQVQTTEIIACDLCEVHLPRAEALTGGRGVYCSDAHRRQAEG
jgi:uncharacterized protein